MSNTTIDKARVQKLFHTATGDRLHIEPCPHVHGAELFEATPEQLEAREVCSWCQSELDGQGRTYYDHLEDAFKAYGSFVETRPLIRERIAGITYDHIWLPNSRSYIALGFEGPVVVWIGKTYVQPAGGELLTLPGYEQGSGGGGRTHTDERKRETCPQCQLVLPASGVCDCTS